MGGTMAETISMELHQRSRIFTAPPFRLLPYPTVVVNRSFSTCPLAEDLPAA